VKRFVWPLALIALAFAPEGAPAGQIAPPGFLAIPGVGPFQPNQIGRFDGTTKKFQGGPLLEDSTGRLAVAGSAVNPLWYVNVDVSGAWNIGSASLQVGARAGTFRITNSDNGFTLGLQATGITTANDSSTLTRGAHAHADFTGTGTTGTLTGVQFAAKNQNSGTVTLALGADSLCEQQVAGGHTLLGSMLRLKYHQNEGTFDELRGLDLSTWGDLAPGVVHVSRGIYADASIDKGDQDRHFIYSLSTSPSDFAGDLAVTDSTRGLVLKDSVTHHFVRITLANGVVTQTDLGTNPP